MINYIIRYSFGFFKDHEKGGFLSCQYKPPMEIGKDFSNEDLFFDNLFSAYKELKICFNEQIQTLFDFGLLTKPQSKFLISNFWKMALQASIQGEEIFKYEFPYEIKNKTFYFKIFLATENKQDEITKSFIYSE
jgi:hypothetical protein